MAILNQPKLKIKENDLVVESTSILKVRRPLHPPPYLVIKPLPFLPCWYYLARYDPWKQPLLLAMCASGSCQTM